MRVEHGDCLEVMRDLAAEGVSVDAIITDPPFIVPTQHYASRAKDNGFRRKWSDISPLVGWFDQVVAAGCELLKPEGHFICFCNADSYAAFYPAVFSRFDVADCVVWNKQNIGMGRGWRKQHELLIVGRSSQSWFSDATFSTVLNCRVVPTDERTHPAQKPQALIEQIIGHVVPPGGVVLDPFAGSGTTGWAATATGRDAILIEADGEYSARIRSRAAAPRPQQEALL